MTKPILWLGPLEDLDVDFDPLLGRSAAEPVVEQSSVLTRKIDDSRSVFDDPIDEPVVVEKVAEPVPAPEPTIAATEVREVEPVAVFEPEPLSLVAASAPEPLAPADDDVTEPKIDAFTPSDDEDREPPKLFAREDAAPELEPFPQSAPPKKPFFERLFASEAFAPVVATAATVGAGGRSINDIWAKSEPAPEIAEDGETDAEPQAVPTAAIDDQVEQPVAQEQIDADIEPERLEQSVENEPQDIELPLAAPVTEADAVVERAEPMELVDNNLVPEVAAELETPIEDVGTSVLAIEDRAPAEAEDSAQEVLESARDEEAFELTPEPAEEVQPESAGPDFQTKFDADNFWAIPTRRIVRDTGQDSDAPVVQEPISEVGAEAFDQPALLEPEAEAALQAKNVPENVAAEPALGAAIPAGPRRRRKKKVKKNYLAAFFGTFLIGIAAIMTLVSYGAPLGYPFDLLANYRWYWTLIAIVAAGIWGIAQGWKMVAASVVVILANLAITIPATGKAPVGGPTATKVLGWANVGNSDAALARTLAEADKKQATLVMIAGAPQSVFTPPAGWTLIEAPVAGDPTAIAVLSKSSWRAVTVPGEPTMARPPAGDLTVIGIHPQDAARNKRVTPERLALINRAATRTGSQAGATVLFGDLNAPAWDRSVQQMRTVGNVTRVRCGGWTASTMTTALGIFGFAADHAFVRDVRVTHCQLGATLASGHKPIWLYVSPEVAPVEPAAE